MSECTHGEGLPPQTPLSAPFQPALCPGEPSPEESNGPGSHPDGPEAALGKCCPQSSWWGQATSTCWVAAAPVEPHRGAGAGGSFTKQPGCSSALPWHLRAPQFPRLGEQSGCLSVHPPLLVSPELSQQLLGHPGSGVGRGPGMVPSPRVHCPAGHPAATPCPAWWERVRLRWGMLRGRGSWGCLSAASGSPVGPHGPKDVPAACNVCCEHGKCATTPRSGVFVGQGVRAGVVGVRAGRAGGAPSPTSALPRGGGAWAPGQTGLSVPLGSR